MHERRSPGKECGMNSENEIDDLLALVLDKYYREADKRAADNRAAMYEARLEAFASIRKQGQAIRDEASKSDQAARETWKAQGALEMWRVAYAAAHRRQLGFEGEVGWPDELPGVTPHDVEETLANARFFRKMGWLRRTTEHDQT